MGNNADRFAKPEHEVSVRRFEVSKHPVTNLQYAEFISGTDRSAPMHWNGKTPPNSISDKPVTNVSWHDADDYCKWLSSRTGKQFRLITETEWEYLARNGVRLGIESILDEYCEWTGTKFSLYPGSSLKDDPNVQEKLQVIDNAYIYRGKCSGDFVSGNDPVTSRLWQLPNSRGQMLAFRVALD